MPFFDTASGNDITAAITGNGWSVGPLAPDAQQNFYVQLLPSTTLTTGAVDTLTVTAVSVNDATRLDVVEAITNYSTTPQPSVTLSATRRPRWASAHRCS